MGAALVGEIMRLIHTLLVAGAFALSGTAASAATQLIHFDELPNNSPQDPYFDPDNNFQLDVVDPADGSVNFSSSANCADPIDGVSGNGSCVVEMDQGTVWELTHDADASGEVGAYGEDEFDLLGFYFHLQGGSPNNASNNFVEIENNDGDTLRWTFMDALNTDLITREDGDPIDSLVDVDNNTGYFVDLTGLADWEDILWVTWTNGTAGHTRVDCIVVSFDGETSQPYDGSTGCGLGTPPDPIPLPAAGWLLIAGLGGLAAMKRRKAS